jgi:hypothetical protein
MARPGVGRQSINGTTTPSGGPGVGRHTPAPTRAKRSRSHTCPGSRWCRSCQVAPIRKGGNGRGGVSDPQGHHCGEGMRDSGGERDDQVRGGDHVGHREKVRHRDCDVARQSPLGQGGVHRAPGAPPRGDERVRQRHVLRQRERVPHGRVVGPHQTHESLLEQRAFEEPRRRAHRRGHTDGQVEIAAREGRRESVPERHRGDPHADPRRRGLQSREERRQQDELRVVRRGDAERAGRGLRLERRGGREGLREPRQGRPQRRLDGLRAGRRHQPAGPPHQQFVPQRVPQPGHRVAHGALRQAQLARGAGHVACLQHGVQDAQQVQVQALQIHGASASVTADDMHVMHSKCEIDALASSHDCAHFSLRRRGSN